MQSIANPIKILLYKSKGIKVAISKCGSLKERWENANSCNTKIYPVVRLATKAHLHPCCWSTHKEYCFSATKSLPWTQSRSPWPRVPLRSFSTKEGGLHVARTKLVVAAPHQVGGSKTCRRVTRTPRMAGSPRYTFVHTRTRAQGSQSCSLTHSRAKLVLNLKM